MLHPNISSLDILKAQRAKKAAAKMAIDSESVTESESEPEIQPPAPVNPPPPTENQPSTSANPPPPAENQPSTSANPPPVLNQLSWNFGDDLAFPPGLCRKNVTRSDRLADTQAAQCDWQHNPLTRSETSPTGRPPVSSASAVKHPHHRAPSSESLQIQASQASQQPPAPQTQSTQRRHSSPVGKSRRPNLKKKK